MSWLGEGCTPLGALVECPHPSLCLCMGLSNYLLSFLKAGSLIHKLVIPLCQELNDVDSAHHPALNNHCALLFSDASKHSLMRAYAHTHSHLHTVRGAGPGHNA
eukprot:1158087-Pelagomonas_calceolata.AAC.5